MKKSKIYLMFGLPSFLLGCSMIHTGLGIAVSGLLLIILSYVEFLDEEEGV